MRIGIAEIKELKKMGTIQDGEGYRDYLLEGGLIQPISYHIKAPYPPV